MTRFTIGLAMMAVLVAGATAALVADTLVMRDGRRIQGELRSVSSSGVIEFLEARGYSTRTLRVNRDEVERIEFNEDTGAGTWGADEPSTRPAGLRERDVTVGANVAWTDTGIDLRPGQTIYFEATGKVRWGPDRRDGPAGEKNSPRNPNRPMPSRPAAALIGRIGADSNDYFFIGDAQGPIRVPARGRLFLGINDDYLIDNSGSFRVTVYY
jgi:hypothetical protein